MRENKEGNNKFQEFIFRRPRLRKMLTTMPSLTVLPETSKDWIAPIFEILGS